MYNYTKQVNTLISRVGFEGNSIPSGFTLDATNLKSESGLHFDYIGSLATVNNITDLYNDRVTEDEDINAVLLKLQKQSLSNVLQNVFSDKSEVYSSFSVYPYEKTGKSSRDKNAQFVGFRLVNLNTDMGSVIERISMIFDANDTIPLKLFCSSDLANPIKEESVTVVANKPTLIDLSGWIVDSSEVENYYYLGYFESEVTANAVKFDNGESIENQICTYVERVKLDVVSGYLDTENYTNDSEGNGMNPHITVFRDYSSFASNNKSLFDKAIQIQMDISVCEMVINSTKINHTSETFKIRFDKAWFMLNGNKEGNIVGLRRKFNAEVDRIRDVLFTSPDVQRVTVAI